MRKYVNPEPDSSPEQPTEKLFEFHYVPDEGVLPGLILSSRPRMLLAILVIMRTLHKKQHRKHLKLGLKQAQRQELR